MVAVGVGIAPMIHTLRAIFRRHDQLSNQLKPQTAQNNESPDAAYAASDLQYLNIKVKLLYGVVRVEKSFFNSYDMLMKNLFSKLDTFLIYYSEKLVTFC